VEVVGEVVIYDAPEAVEQSSEAAEQPRVLDGLQVEEIGKEREIIEPLNLAI